MKRMIYLILLILLSGCAKMTTQITVDEDNTYYSTYPELKVKINNEFSYDKEKSMEVNTSGKSVGGEVHSYDRVTDHYFRKVNEKEMKIEEQILIRIYKTSLRWDYMHSFKGDQCDKKDIIKLAGKKYMYCARLIKRNYDNEGFAFKGDALITIYRITGPRNNILVKIKYEKDIEGVDFTEDNNHRKDEILKKLCDEVFSEDFDAFKIL